MEKLESESNEELKKEIASRQQALEALQESEARYRRIIGTTMEGVWLIDAQSKTTFVNNQMAEMLGYTVEEMLGTPLFAFMDEEGRAIATVHVERRRQGIEERHEFKFRRSDGSDLWASLSTNAIFDRSGQYAGALAMVSDITSRKQALEALRQQTEREQLVADIAQRIRQTLSLREILSTTVAEVRQFLQTDRVFIYRFEPDWGGVVVVESVASDCPTILGAKLKDPSFVETYIQLYKQGRIQVTADIYAAGLTQCYIDFLAQFQVRATLVVPILQGEQLWGLLVANHCSEPRQWQQLEIDLLKQLATQLAIALQQSQLYEQTLQQIQREQALNRVIQTIRNSLDLTTIFSTAAFEIANLLQADRAAIVQYLLEQKLWLNVADYRSSPDLPVALGLEIPDEGNEIAARLKQLEVIRIDDASTCEDKINRGFAQTFPGAWLLVPLHFGPEVWGSLSLVRNRQPFSWQDWEVELTCAVTDQLAIAIQQSTLFEQAQIELTKRQRAEENLRARARQQAVVAKLSQSALADADLSALMDEAVALIAQSLEVEYSKVLELLPNGNTLLLQAGVGWHTGLVGHATVGAQTDSQAGYTLLSSKPVIVEDLRTETRFTGPPLLHDHGVVSGMSVIIHGQNRPFGILGAHTTRPRTFTQNDIHFLQVVANVLATAIERKWNEQKIREQAALLDVSTDAIAVRDLENHILFWNKGAESLYGWKAANALGKNANELLDKESSPKLEEALHTVVKKGEWYGELHKVTKSGMKIIVNSRWTLVRDEQGQPKSILTVDTDITEKKQLEAQFLRTQRLESLGTLASGIAHDLNNVLAPILMSVQLLEMKFPDEHSQRLLKRTEAGIKRGAALVKQVLSFVRGVEGEHTILQVRHLIFEIEQIAKQTFPKSIEVYTDSPSHLWTVSGNATQLHQVLINLCVNARDAMPDGGTLSICAENLFIDAHYARMNLEAKVGAYVVITVSDTGTGMPPEILERIFEPFFTTKEFGLGTGLGLSTVIGIIKSHSGFVNVASQVGKGTQFQVFLPAVSATQTPSVEDLELPKGHGELILVVDDEVPIRDITKISLETYNYKVRTASDGIEAIALYAQHKDEISVVLMDMMMPSMDGATTIRTLQKINPKVKIIAVSGLGSNDQVALAASAGVKAFLSKPYTAKELLKTINTVMRPRAQ
jgi:PAS domain S-box-containing protein